MKPSDTKRLPTEEKEKAMRQLFGFPVCAAVLLAGFGLAGCDDRPYYVAAPPPPPPVAYVPVPPPPSIGELGSRNGFRIGLDEGARASAYGARYEPRRTAAYRDAPGYDPQLGPGEIYVNAFRNAYLRGYDRGFYHR